MCMDISGEIALRKMHVLHRGTFLLPMSRRWYVQQRRFRQGSSLQNKTKWHSKLEPPSETIRTRNSRAQGPSDQILLNCCGKVHSSTAHLSRRRSRRIYCPLVDIPEGLLLHGQESYFREGLFVRSLLGWSRKTGETRTSFKRVILTVTSPPFLVVVCTGGSYDLYF
jgi:hypothetical protein